MKKSLSFLITLMLLVGMLAVGATSALAAEHIHSFDKNGNCTVCGAAYSFDDYCEGGVGCDKSLSFKGAKSLTVKISKINAYNGPIDFYDGQGNLVESYTGSKGSVDYTITIPGDTMRVTHVCVNDGGFFKGQGGFVLASITPNYDNNTGSVLSEGNLWIILAVAVVAVGGFASLCIMKKKKKPATVNGASTDDE